MATIQEIEKEFYDMGYRWRIQFDMSGDDWPMPIRCKEIKHIGPMIRSCYPNEKNWTAVKINSDGSDGKTNIVPANLGESASGASHSQRVNGS